MHVGRVIAFLALAVAASAHAQQVEVVRIGHVVPLSGGLTHYGRDIRNAATMAVADLNKRELVIGGKRIEFKLEVEDDAGDPKQSTAVAIRFCDLKVAGVVGHITSGTAIPASRVYSECGIPMITPGATNPRLTQQGYKTTFRMVAHDGAISAAVAAYVVNKMGVKRFAVMDDRTAYGQGLTSQFKARLSDLNVQPLAEEFVSDKQVDFATVLTRMKGAGVDAIFFGGTDAQGGPMLRQMQQLGMTNVRLIGGDGLCSTKIHDLSGGSPLVNNVICGEGGASDKKMPSRAEWRARYDQQFPGEFVLFSPYAYDGFMVLADAMKRADSVDPQRYLPKMFETNLRSVTNTIQFDAHGDLRNAAVTINSFRDGKKTAVE